MSWDANLSNAETGAEVHRLPNGMEMPTTMSARQLQQADFPPVSWIVCDLIPEGVTLLAGTIGPLLEIVARTAVLHDSLRKFRCMELDFLLQL